MADDNPSSARVLPKKKDFSWTGWQTTTPRGVASIAQRYKGANPYGNPAGVAQVEWLLAPPVQNPNITDAPAAANPALTDGSVPPVPGQTVPSGSPDAPVASVVNPNTGFPASTTPAERAEDERQRWLAEGGSDATLHRAQVAAGMKPAIDARGPQQPPSAADQIRAGWGWEPSVTSGSQGTAVAAQMTKDFTAPGTRSGNQQATWNQKFTDARARLRQSLAS